MSTNAESAPPLGSLPPASKLAPWLMPFGVLAIAYALLGLTLTEQLSHQQIMQRCVLMDPNRARIWSVGNVEIGLAYLGVFFGMVYYFLRMYSRSRQHMIDLGLAMAYLLGSFALDYFCVQTFHPFMALFVGDAVVMTFAVLVSRQVWFQRLLGVFVPVIFLTCGIGHFLEGLSYWQLTYPINTPWTMVTADVGFAVLVNANRFPAFIRGEDVVAELAIAKTKAEALQAQIDARLAAEEARERAEAEASAAQARLRGFLQDVLASVTEGKLHLCYSTDELPIPLSRDCEFIELSNGYALKELRERSRTAAGQLALPDERWQDLITAVSEAGMNAIVHAGGGEGRVCVSSERIQVWIEDHGQGIDVDRLPQATLEKGYTTAGTLGHGMKMMLGSVDRMWLLTGTNGTRVVMEMDRVAPKPNWANL